MILNRSISILKLFTANALTGWVNTPRLRKYQAILSCSVTSLLLLMQPTLVEASELQEWLSSEARAELLLEFEANDCRLTLTEVSDILFEHDASEQHIYTERLILMEPEQSSLSFPVVLVKGNLCNGTVATPIKVPAARLAHANNALALNSCSMEISALEALTYPEDSAGDITATDRRNTVSELYNRGDITFRYYHENGTDKLRVHKLTDVCTPKADNDTDK